VEGPADRRVAGALVLNERQFQHGNGTTAASVGRTMTIIGIIGAGHIGSQVARAAITAGYDVVISNSRGPETLTDLVAELGPRASAATSTEAAAAGDFAVVTVPLKAYRDVPVGELAGKTVIDTNNYYFERDGRIDALDNGETTVSSMLQEHLPTSRVVKGFNHIKAVDITTDGAPTGAPNRRALATSSDSPEALELIEKVYDEFGFDTVNVGPLSESWRVERDQPAYGVRQNADELVANLALATRNGDTE
jgi:predicted dinucleotide-binding enzyme